MLSCDWCGRPEVEEPIEPAVVNGDPMMLCEECRGGPKEVTKPTVEWSCCGVPVKTVGLYFGLGAIGVVMLAAYAWVAPGANQSAFTGVVFAFCVGQAFLISRVVSMTAAGCPGEVDAARTHGSK